MNKPIKRFRVFNREQQTRVSEADTLQEVFDYLQPLENGVVEELFIDDCVDDIEVDATEFIEAWNEGERPGDLQMF